MFVQAADYCSGVLRYVSLMEWQRRVSDWASANQLKINAALVLFFITGDVLAAIFVPVEGSEIPADWLAYFLIVASSLTLWWRRSNPLAALIVCSVFIITYWVRDYPGGIDPALWVLFFSATRHGGPNRRKVWQTVGLVLVAILVTATIGVIVPTEDLPLAGILGVFFIHGTAAAVGEALYQRSQYVSELEQRAASLEADLENKAALAAVEERTRIAREMHDIIAHGMSSVVVQAVAGQSIVDSNPAKAREVLETIESIGRDSVDEMRRMLGVLRDNASDVELEPQPGFSDMTALARHAEEAGVAVSMTVTGEPRQLPPGVDLTGYRVVQEALTNIIRHSGRPVRAEATITYSENAVDIAVIDDGLGAAAPKESEGTGHGLLGMSERVEIYNGSFAAGPRPGGGYQVHVSLPLPTRVSA